MKPVIYVAHPVSTGDPIKNAEKAIRWVKWLTEEDDERIYIAPWVAEVLGFSGGTLTSDFYQRVLDDDCVVVSKLDGVIGVGGEGWTKGMSMERATAKALHKTVLDFTQYSEPTDVPSITDVGHRWDLADRDQGQPW